MSLERRDTNALQNRSGNIPEHKHGKPGNEWGRFPEWSSSWSRHLPQPDYTKIWPRNWPRHGDKGSERESLRPWHGDKVQEEIRHCPHMVIGFQEDIPYCSHGTSFTENERRRAPQVSHNSAMRTPLGKRKQTRFCWPLSSWRASATPPTSRKTLTKIQKCLSPSRQQCPRSTGNQWNLNCLKIYSKGDWKSKISSQKKTK